jgi:hypothetical protein
LYSGGCCGLYGGCWRGWYGHCCPWNSYRRRRTTTTRTLEVLTNSAARPTLGTAQQRGTATRQRTNGRLFPTLGGSLAPAAAARTLSPLVTVNTTRTLEVLTNSAARPTLGTAQQRGTGLTVTSGLRVRASRCSPGLSMHMPNAHSQKGSNLSTRQRTNGRLFPTLGVNERLACAWRDRASSEKREFSFAGVSKKALNKLGEKGSNLSTRQRTNGRLFPTLGGSLAPAAAARTLSPRSASLVSRESRRKR